ncbi:MAG: hypothetical protein IPO72_16485 [Saprospiraceae bacterium]|nr:hypothetical protein [Candidatus Vicinibacter affinis]
MGIITNLILMELTEEFVLMEALLMEQIVTWGLFHQDMKARLSFTTIDIMLPQNVHNFKINRMDSTPINNTILFFGLLFWSINLLGQKTRTFSIHGGPSITNVQEIINGEKHFFASPERPYYSIRYHFGICVEENIFSKEYLGVKYGLNFDKRASSHTSFNKYNEDFYGFIGIPLQITYKPLKDRDIQFEAGVSFQYLVYSKYLL